VKTWRIIDLDYGRQTDNTSTSSSWARNFNELLPVYSNLLFRGGRLNHLLNTARDYI